MSEIDDIITQLNTGTYFDEVSTVKPVSEMSEVEKEDEVFRRLSTPPVKNFPSTIIPIIRRIIPTTIAQDIIGVQPMTILIGQAMRIKMKDGE